MHGVVHSKFDIRRLRSLRRPSFAGNGLPERMRSTAFAFLGLTAALGLALVAVFAHLSFPVLAPAPPPAGPAGEAGVSSSLALDRGPGATAPQPALLGAARSAVAAGGDGTRSPGRSDGGARGVGSPIPVEEPGETVEPSDDGGGAEPTPSATPSTPTPVGEETTSTEAAPAAAPTSVPTTNPKPVTSTPKPQPEEKPPKPAEPEPTEPDSNPGKSHGGPKPVSKPVEKPKPPKAEAPPAPAPPPPPAPEPPADKGDGGNGKGKALGHYK
jgi:hypothetical protein